MFQNLTQRLLVSPTELMDVNNADLTSANTSNHNIPPPPPYPIDSDSDSDSDEDEGTNESENEREQATSSRHRCRCQPPIKLMINAAHHIQGSGNVIPVSPNPLADAARLSMTLATALGRVGGAQPVGNAASSAAATVSSTSALHQMQTRGLDITINCGVTVIGDRNMIGPVGIRKPAMPGTSLAPGTPVARQGPPTAALVPPLNSSGPTSQADAVVPPLQTNESNALHAGGMKRKAEETPACESPTKKVADGSEHDE